MITKINDELMKQGLTLEEAYILGRVKYYCDEEIPYIESNLTIAKAMGKSESTVKRSINNLVLNGYLNKETVGRTRTLSISGIGFEPSNVHNEPHKDKPKETNRMSDEELRAEFESGIERLKKIRMERELEND